MMFDPDSYNIIVRKADFDGEQLYEATVREFPDLAEYGVNYQEAYELAIDTIETTLEYFLEKGRVLPTPIDKKVEDFSGRVTLRLPKSLHKAISETAEHEDISLNQMLVSVISNFNGFNDAVQNTSYITRKSIGIPRKHRAQHLKLVSDKISSIDSEMCYGQ